MEPGPRVKRHRTTLACARCYKSKQKCDRGTPRCLRCVTAGAECTAINRQTSSEVPRSPVQYLEQRLAELQRGTPERQRADAERLPHVLNIDRQHNQILDIATASMEKHTTASLLNSHTVLQHRSKLFYPSERPPLKIPVQGIYHDTYTRTAGQEYGIQFSHFNARKMPLDVAARLFDNYMDNILPRFPCFMEEDLSEKFRQFYHEIGDNDTRSSTTEFIVNIILAISSLSSKRHDFRKVAALSESLHADAMRHVAFLRDASIMSLQCLLLLIQLALLLPHTANLWYLSGEAMRMAVSLGLHQDPETTIISGPVYGEIRRRLFWVTYQLDRTVAIAAGCPIALSDEHITTQLPFNGGHRRVNPSEYMAGLSPAPKEKQFLIQTYVCLIQSEIHAVQFFDHPIPARASDYDTWVQQTEMSVRNLVEQVRADGVATPWLVSAAHQCQVLLHRPCSRNLAVSESSLVAAATASIDLINTSLESVVNGGFVVVFELANSAFQAGMVLLYALRNHASELQQASLIKRSESALEDLGKLFDGLSRRWPALSDTKYYLKQLVDTNLRNPVGNYGSEYDMNVLEELDCLVTQRRIHSIYHRNIPLPIPLKGTPQSDASSQISPGFLDDDTWWRYFINEDFDMEDHALQPNTPMPAPALKIQKVTPENLDPPAWNPNLSNSRTTYDKILDTLPACSFCRDRRIKCHQQLPACKECFRTSRECMFFDPILAENIPLRRICSLVDMIKSLEERHAASFAVMPQRSLPDDPSRTPPRTILVPTPCALDQSASLPYKQTRFAPSKSFFGPWSSLGFLATVMKRTPLWNSTRTIQTAFEMFEPVSISTLTPQIHRPPMSVASGLFRLFSMSANTFFPILDASSLKGIISEYYDAGDDARFGHTQELFYLILAIAATIARNEPVLAAWSKAYFNKATNQLDPSCDHSSRHANISLLQRTLLICIYLLLSPESGDIWRHLGFAIRLFFDLSHRPSLDKDEDDSLFCTLTRTLYCLESQVSIAFGRPSLLIIGDTLRDELTAGSTETFEERISISFYLISFHKLQIHNALLRHDLDIATSAQEKVRANHCQEHRRKLDEWFVHWKEILASMTKSEQTCELTSWGELNYYQGLFMISHLWPTPGGQPVGLCENISKACAQLARSQQRFAYPRSDVGGQRLCRIFPMNWTTSHLVFQVGLNIFNEETTTDDQKHREATSLMRCLSLLSVLETDPANLLTSQSDILQELYETRQ